MTGKQPPRQTALEQTAYGSPGPFQVIDSQISGLADQRLEPPRRRYSCENYETCLNLAAALNWDNFTCRGCCGTINQTLSWRAHQETRKDSVARCICSLPDITVCSCESGPQTPLKAAGNR